VSALKFAFLINDRLFIEFELLKDVNGARGTVAAASLKIISKMRIRKNERKLFIFPFVFWVI